MRLYSKQGYLKVIIAKWLEGILNGKLGPFPPDIRDILKDFDNDFRDTLISYDAESKTYKFKIVYFDKSDKVIYIKFEL